MKKISTRVRKGNFTENDVTPRHFVTAHERCDQQPSAVLVQCRLAPVIRRYLPESASVEELVEVLYRLLVDVPANESAIGPAPAGSSCFPSAAE
jgi:hypothetical protein